MAMPARACVHCSVAHRSWWIPLSVSPNSDESRKQSLYPDGDPDRHQNLIICSLDHGRRQAWARGGHLPPPGNVQMGICNPIRNF